MHSNPEKQPTETELMDQAAYYLHLTMQYAGPGPWKANTEVEDPDGPVWKPGEPGVGATPCDLHSTVYRVSGMLFGPPSADPAADAARVAKGWEAHGFTVRTVVDVTDLDGGRNIEIAATDQTGGGPGYFAATDGTSIDVVTQCSTDPSLQELTEDYSTPPPYPDEATTPEAAPKEDHQPDEDDVPGLPPEDGGPHTTPQEDRS